MGQPKRFTETEKWCERCQKTLPNSMFNKNDSRASGLEVYCARCKRFYAKIAHLKDPRRVMLCDARRRAMHDGIPFSLTVADIYVPMLCPILGIPIKWGSTPEAPHSPQPNSPSLDRVVPVFGYIPGNVVVISHRANTIKNDGTIEEHERVVNYIRRFSI